MQLRLDGQPLAVASEPALPIELSVGNHVLAVKLDREHLPEILRAEAAGVAIGGGHQDRRIPEPPRPLELDAEHVRMARRHRDAVDVEEILIALAEPVEVAAVVCGIVTEGHQHAGDVAIVLGDPEVFGAVEEATHACRIERQDAGAGGIVEG